MSTKSDNQVTMRSESPESTSSNDSSDVSVISNISSERTIDVDNNGTKVLVD